MDVMLVDMMVVMLAVLLVDM